MAKKARACVGFCFIVKGDTLALSRAPPQCGAFKTERRLGESRLSVLLSRYAESVEAVILAQLRDELVVLAAADELCRQHAGQILQVCFGRERLAILSEQVAARVEW